MKPKLNATEWLLMAIEPAAADEDIITLENGLKEPVEECGFIIGYDENTEAACVAREAAISLMMAWSAKAYLTDLSDLSSYGGNYASGEYAEQVRTVAGILMNWADSIGRQEVKFHQDSLEYEQYLALKKRFEPEEGK